ncbi:MAG TPA: 2-C-methyl-D-erythritol 2,4-cyclodiphosphate synthase [Flavobacteriales bacterium]|nr:2-C-methyl-D-erythritol 2,4-cyclodiphosphate synthase [Flavobacteriales bacterium]
MKKVKVGFGIDVHQLASGRNCILGGVNIPHDKGPLGHSDADVLLHAICDALLGAAGLKDIGTYYPDTDKSFKNIDSKILLKDSFSLIKERGYAVSNVDCSVVVEQPKLKPHIDTMRQNIARILEIDTEDVSVKATTNEKMGFIGREEGVVAYAVVLLVK